MADVSSDDTSKYLLSGLIAIASFLAARVFERFDKGASKTSDTSQALQIEVAVLKSRIEALERSHGGHREE